MGAVGNIVVRVGADTRPVQQGLRQAQVSVQNFQTNVSKSLIGMKTAIAALATGAAGIFAKDAISDAMSYEAALQQIGRMLGQNSKDFMDWASNQAAAFNLSRGEAVKYGSSFATVLSSMTSDQAELMRYTEQMLKTSSVIASARGEDIEDVMSRIRSGLLGETESIENLGINVEMRVLEATEAFKKFAGDKSWQQLSYQTQQQIRLFAIMEQATNKYGSEIRQNTASSVAGLTSVLKDVKLNIGLAFLPIINQAIPILVSFAEWLRTVTASIAALSQALFGTNSAQQQNAQTAKNAAAAQANLGNATKKAGDKAKKGVQGFDEINQLQEALADNADAAAGAMGAVSAPAAPTTDTTSIDTGLLDGIKNSLEPVSTSITNLKTALEPLRNKVGEGLNDFYVNVLVPLGKWILGEGLPRFIDIITKGLQQINLGNINTDLLGLYESIKPFALNVGNGLLWFFDNVLVPIGVWTVNEVVPAFLRTLKGAFDVLNPALEAFKPIGEWLWVNFLKPIADWTGGVIVDALKGIGDSLTKVGDWMKNNKSTVDDMALAISAFALTWGALTLAVNLWKAKTIIATAVQWAWNIAASANPIGLIIIGIAALVAGIVLLIKHWDDVKAAAQWCWDQMVAIWDVVAEWFNTNVVQPVATFFSDMWQGIVDTFSGVGTWFSETFTAAYDSIALAFSFIGTWASDRWKDITDIFDGVSAWFSKIFSGAYTKIGEAFSAIGTWASDRWKDITDIFDKVGTWFSETFGKAYDGVKEAFSKVGEFFGGVWDTIKSKFVDIGVKIGDAVGSAFKTAINAVLSTIENIINGFFDMINGAVDMINKIPGVSIGKLEHMVVPKLAEGGITSGPTLAMIGDNPGGNELVMPLGGSVMDDFASTIGNAVLAAMQFNQPSQINSQPIILKINDTEFARAIIPAVDKERSRIGNSMVIQTA